eukprot:c42595_g1_i1 orf=138-377(+)
MPHLISKFFTKSRLLDFQIPTKPATPTIGSSLRVIVLHLGKPHCFIFCGGKNILQKIWLQQKRLSFDIYIESSMLFSAF